MAGKGGKRVGAGRKPGAKSKKTAEILAKAEAGGILPLEYMLRVMRDLGADDARRDDMAKAAAPYLHSKMPQKMEGDFNGKLIVSWEK